MTKTDCLDCPIGQDVANTLISNDDSIFDAVYDYIMFTAECKKMCKRGIENEGNNHLEE